MSDYGQYFLPDHPRLRDLRDQMDPPHRPEPAPGGTTFSEIRDAAPGVPRSLLATRLHQLELAGVVERRPPRTRARVGSTS